MNPQAVTTAVDLTQILLAVVTGVFTVLAAVVPIMIQKYVTDKKMADVLERGLQNSLGVLQQASEQEIRAAAIKLPHVPVAVAPAVQYMLDHANDARLHFGLTDQLIAEKIIARMGVKNIETNIAIAGSAGPLTPDPIAPVPSNVNGGPHPDTVKVAPSVKAD
jgi:hypothetical protein